MGSLPSEHGSITQHIGTIAGATVPRNEDEMELDELIMLSASSLLAGKVTTIGGAFTGTVGVPTHDEIVAAVAVAKAIQKEVLKQYRETR